MLKIIEREKKREYIQARELNNILASKYIFGFIAIFALALKN